ncbi:response regulator transcription factor [Pseudomonas corrugata]|uniref:response regulator transcription factor n=1 Tax=Pseudomonas corrugata TaxID=47879 RepID=UPI002231C16C|nr:response regulator transcription factor [Pseudomonas corrugata]UZD97766.1 response regulator transcription factor [Pseudomonas corrugata]
MSKKVHLLIADDHAIMREGLKQLFVFAQDLEVVAEAENGAMVLERLHQGDIDLVLLDVNMPGLSGVDMISRIHTQYPAQKILVLSMHDEPQIALHMIRAGATGYLCKVCSLETLLSAIRRVVSGARFLDPQIAQRIALDVSRLNQHLHHGTLTERELQVLLLLAGGTSVSRIADMLTISSKTVSTHKSRLMEKMGFSSNAEIVRYAVGQQLIE